MVGAWSIFLVLYSLFFGPPEFLWWALLLPMGLQDIYDNRRRKEVHRLEMVVVKLTEGGDAVELH